MGNGDPQSWTDLAKVCLTYWAAWLVLALGMSLIVRENAPFWMGLVVMAVVMAGGLLFVVTFLPGLIASVIVVGLVVLTKKIKSKALFTVAVCGLLTVWAYLGALAMAFGYASGL